MEGEVEGEVEGEMEGEMGPPALLDEGRGRDGERDGESMSGIRSLQKILLYSIFRRRQKKINIASMLDWMRFCSVGS